jgi:DNA-3-methyladenine glycosylase
MASLLAACVEGDHESPSVIGVPDSIDFRPTYAFPGIMFFMRILPATFYDRNAEYVAPELLGKLLVRRIDGRDRIGRIVETEAYLGPHDLAAHSSRGRTRRTEVMFGPPGHAYVYLIYGMYHCINAVTGPGEHASAVLLRALEPLSEMGPTNGPGRLCRAMEIDRRLNGHDLTQGELLIAEPAEPIAFDVVVRPRVGVDYAGEWAERPLRFYIAGNKYVSRK